MIKKPKCPVCNKESALVNGYDIYPHRPDLGELNFYRCEDHKDFYVGCHKGTINPLGVLADKEHRKLKMMCHKVFDPIWKSGKRNRKELYNKLSSQMEKKIDDTHFGMFSKDELEKAYQFINSWER
jgi:hypothetical protein